MMIPPTRLLRFVVSGICLMLFSSSAKATQEISFSQQIQPLLARYCFACHGPDEQTRGADLRLDQRESALDYAAIVPGQPAESEMIARLNSSDDDLKMPPPEAHDFPNAEEIQLLEQWIAQGANYQHHWAFLPPHKTKLPELTADHWAHNPIDQFIAQQHKKHTLSHAPQADRMTMVRRLFLDLTGLPPTPEQADQFVNSSSSNAYEQLVDQLLASDQYAEHWALQWLDLARYADSNGYEKDRPRTMWPYRDWVIKAIDQDMPFDQFTIEQLAGDMLPSPTDDQMIATGFHRNTMLNEEGGIDPLEFRFYAMVDRVGTTGKVWMGLTTECAQCHTHKYDPITHTEYYELMALLNNADEVDLQLNTDTANQKRYSLLEQIHQQELKLPLQFPDAGVESPTNAQRRTAFEAELAIWWRQTKQTYPAWNSVSPIQATSNGPLLSVEADHQIIASGDATKRDVYSLTFSKQDLPTAVTALRLEALPDPRLPASGPGLTFYEGRKGYFFLSELTVKIDGRPVELATLTVSNGTLNSNADLPSVIDRNGSSGWASNRVGEADHLVAVLKQPAEEFEELTVELLFERHFVAGLGKFRLSFTSDDGTFSAQPLPSQWDSVMAEKPMWEDLTPAQQQELELTFCRVTPLLAQARKPIDKLYTQLPEPLATMIFQERPAHHPRPTYRHHRGEYLSPEEQIEPGIPNVLLQATQEPQNRLEFARWLVSKQNPLTSRVIVNRLWRAFFGKGLVKTNGDFGTQSTPPTHPELLDWLACELIDNGWSIKAIQKQIVMSATYQQASKVDEQQFQSDPQNDWYTRGARFRLQAETIRDTFLKASELLSQKRFGPPVYPPQPESVSALAYGNAKWEESQGEDRYRRSIYTFRKRTAPFAAFNVFDAPSGEVCTARRDRSNTPLQALTLLNDELYLEMARALGLNAASPDASSRQIVVDVFRHVLTRMPDDQEQTILINYFESQLQRIEAGDLTAAEICKADTATARQAAATLLARVVMNLDEAITRQ